MACVFFSLFVFTSPFAMLSFSFRSICFVAFTQFFFVFSSSSSAIRIVSVAAAAAVTTVYPKT